MMDPLGERAGGQADADEQHNDGCGEPVHADSFPLNTIRGDNRRSDRLPAPLRFVSAAVYAGSANLREAVRPSILTTHKEVEEKRGSPSFACRYCRNCAAAAAWNVTSQCIITMLE